MNSVVWETPEGKWSRAYFVTKDGKTDHSQFEWASCNHDTKESAIRAGDEEAPFIVVLFSDNEKQVGEYEMLAHRLLGDQGVGDFQER